MNALTLIEAAYRKAGIESPDAAKLSYGLDALNNLLASWSNDNLLVPSLTTENFTLVIGQGSYTIGTSGNFNTARPDLIENAYIRDGDTDYFLTEISSKDYDNITVKNITSKPGRFYFLASYPLAKIYFDYVPDKAYGFYIDSWKPIASLSAITDTISISSGYEKALIFNLAVDLAGDDATAKINPSIYQIAEDSKAMLERRHAQQLVVPDSVFDSAIVKNGVSFNINKGE